MGLKDWIDAANAGGIFGRPRRSNGSDKDRDRQIVDISTARDFVDALAEQYGVALVDVRIGDNPPDCYAFLGERAVGIELKELRRRHRYEFWSEDQLAAKIDEVLDAETKHYGFAIDALVLHTDEYWITTDLASRCVQSHSWVARSNLKSAWLLLSADPHWPTQEWPVFRLYGDIA